MNKIFLGKSKVCLSRVTLAEKKEKIFCQLVLDCLSTEDKIDFDKNSSFIASKSQTTSKKQQAVMCSSECKRRSPKVIN
jgi:hypothetical protein